ncbi:MAG: replicative DNA helicase [Deltaproteobacteria bacterium]|nr:replicative DNA helicase [Deltaproteobacteria bacterium]
MTAERAAKLEILSTRVPPQDLDAEQSVLGAVLLENQSINRVLEIIVPDDFYRESHKKIYRAILSLFERNEPADLITLKEELIRQGDLEAIGGVATLSSLVDRIPTAANISHYAKIVREKSILRRLIQSATDIITQGYQGGGDADWFLDYAEKSIFEIAQKKIKQPFHAVKDIVKDSFKAIERLYERKELITGVPTGFVEIDRLTAGLQASDLIVIAGRPSMGKTALALNMVVHASTVAKVPCAVFSLEMSKEQLVQRMLCTEARVDSSKLRSGFLSESDWPKLTRAAGILSEAPIFIDDSPALTVLDMRAKARRLQREHGLGLVIVDYLQLMRGYAGSESREREISEISRSLKELAKELSVPVVALSQLNRMVENRKPPIPVLADLRESGAIEQDADVIAFIYREEVYDRESLNKGVAEVIIGKQRNGPTGFVKLAFLSSITRFENLAREFEAAMPPPDFES